MGRRRRLDEWTSNESWVDSPLNRDTMAQMMCAAWMCVKRSSRLGRGTGGPVWSLNVQCSGKRSPKSDHKSRLEKIRAIVTIISSCSPLSVAGLLVSGRTGSSFGYRVVLHVMLERGWSCLCVSLSTTRHAAQKSQTRRRPDRYRDPDAERDRSRAQPAFKVTGCTPAVPPAIQKPFWSIDS
ncbi:hypothetical protein HDK64DRAFT_282646 [Phyllosticta capitalensis]